MDDCDRIEWLLEVVQKAHFKKGPSYH